MQDFGQYFLYLGYIILGTLLGHEYYASTSVPPPLPPTLFVVEVFVKIIIPLSLVYILITQCGSVSVPLATAESHGH